MTTSITFIPAEANFVQSSMQVYFQNRSAMITDVGRDLAGTILVKVRASMQDGIPINFEQPEVKLMQYLFTNLLQGHGKPNADLDWTYWVHFDPNTRQLITNVLNKLGETLAGVEGNQVPFDEPSSS